MEQLLEKIKKDIENLKINSFYEKEIPTNCNFLAVKEGIYHLNNGKIIKREGIMKKVGTGDAVCVFAVTSDQKIIIVIQPRVSLPTQSKVNIEIPAGYKEMGEDSILAGLRELEEETGYTTNDIIFVDSYYTSLGFSSERIDLLLALNCQKVADQHLDSDEFIFCEIVSLEEFEYLLNHQYILDANARIGYYKYLEYLMKEGY